MTNKHFQSYWITALLCVFSLGGYLLVSCFVYGIGFPLDDAWIHQTYARNLARLGQWSFFPGQPSAGSTAPLWSALLSLGYLFENSAYTWTFFLGWLSLLGTALAGACFFRLLAPRLEKRAVWAAVFLLLEWHLVWAAVSGMETLLFALIVLLVLSWLLSPCRNWLWIGVLIGLSLWVRPDGATLCAPAIYTLYFKEENWKERITSFIFLVSGILVILIPYLALNYSLSGAVMPNTYFAKQAEYAVHQQLPLFRRFLQQAGLPLVGAGAALLPGFILFVVRAFHKRAFPSLAGAAWLLGYMFMYALRLPVTYQHGRYMIPAMPLFFIYSLAGMFGWLAFDSLDFWRRILSKVWVIALVSVLLLFWFLGAQAYAMDVALIETEMAATARWVSVNLEPEAYLAAHDIGALGFFSDHKILDLAGLVSPQVIPFMRDEDLLRDYLDENQVDYLITFPDWYPQLVDQKEWIFKSNSVFSKELGAQNMTVYRWRAP